MYTVTQTNHDGRTTVIGHYATEREAEQAAADAMLDEQMDYDTRVQWERCRSTWEVEINPQEERDTA